MRRKFSILAILLCLIASNVFSQTAETEENDAAIAELESQAIELLTETSRMASMLAASENRVSFSLKTGDILWEHDQAEAERLFRSTMEDTRRYVAQVNTELNQLQGMAASNWANAQSSRDVRAKIRKASQMISNLINTLSKHDSEMAFQFLQEVRQIIDNQEFERRTRSTFRNLESTIARRLAEQDVTKSLEFARKKLSEGFSYQIANLLGTIYRKDAEKGAEFAKEIMDKAKTSNLNSNSTWFLMRLLRQGSSSFERSKQSKSDKPPMFGEQDLRELSELVSDQYLKNSNNNRRSRRISKGNLDLIAKYAPQKAAQISQRQSQSNITLSGVSVAESAQKDNFRTAMQNISKAKREYQQEIRESISGLNAEGITPEQRREVIQQTRGKILAVNNSDFRFSNLVWLAIAAKSAGEIEYAQMLLSQAEGFVNRQPQDREDFRKNRRLADAYASIYPERSFEILEDLIYRLNGVIESYIKYSQYQSNRTITENGELLLNNSTRQFTNYLAFSPNIYKALAENDFNRTKNLADKFNRLELRVDARLKIAGGLLRASQQMQNAGDEKAFREEPKEVFIHK